MPNASSIEIANVTVSQYHVFTAPEQIATDANLGTIYLTSTTTNLTVMSASSYALIGRISLPGIPFNPGIVVDSMTNMIYVLVLTCVNGTGGISNCEGGTKVREITEIDGSNNSVIGEIRLPLSWLAIDSSSGVLYASQTGTNFLIGVDPQSSAIVANVSVGDIRSIAVNPKANMVYAETCTTNSLFCDGEVVGVNGSTGQVQFSIPVTYAELGNLAVDPATDTVFALGIIPGVELLSIDGATGAVRYLSILARCEIYSGTEKLLAFNPTLNQVYVISNVFMIAINAGTGQEAYSLGIPGALSGVASPDGHEVFLAMGPSTLANIDTGYLLVIPGMANESYVTDFAQLGCHGP